MKFKFLLIQDGDVIDTFEVDVPHEGFVVEEVAFKTLKKRSVAQTNDRVKDFIAKGEKVKRVTEEITKKLRKSETLTSKEEGELEGAWGDLYATNITMDREPVDREPV